MNTEDALRERMSEFLLERREKSGLSQAEVALFSFNGMTGRSIDQKTVSRIERNPLKADIDKLLLYLNAVGTSLEAFHSKIEEVTKMSLGEIKVNSKQGAMIDKAQKDLHMARSKLSEMLNGNDELDYLKEFELDSFFDEANHQLDTARGKPIIALLGYTDSAKSTLLNTILQGKFVPEEFQPATMVVNILAHENDKPFFIKSQVIIMAKGFQPYMLHDKESVEKYLIIEGGLPLLEEYGLHNYSIDIDSNASEAYLAFVFVNNPLLEKVWLMDTPGDMSPVDDGVSDDTLKALAGAELADGMLYTSKFMGYLTHDLGFFTNVLRSFAPISDDNMFAHLRFVPSFCFNDFSSADIQSAIRKTYDRIFPSLEEAVFLSWKQDAEIAGVTDFQSPNKLDLIESTIPFEKNNPNYVKRIFKEVDEMSNFLILHKEDIANQRIEISKNALINKLATVSGVLKSRMKSTERRKEEVAAKVARFRDEKIGIDKEFDELILSCQDYMHEDIGESKELLSDLSSEERIIHILENEFVSKSDAEKNIGDVISQKISAKLERMLKNSGNSVNLKLNSLLDRWQVAIPSQVDCISRDGASGSMGGSFTSDFSSKAAFVGGLSGLTAYGAMALYVSTIASNLGAYILVGKVAGVLTSLGLVSNVTVVTSFVAAIGGPVTIGLVLAAGIGYLTYRVVGGNWEKGLAKKVSKAIRKQDITDDIVSSVVEFWNNTKSAMLKGYQSLVEDTEEHISKLEKDSYKDYDTNALKKLIEIIDSVKSFIKGGKV